MVFEVCTAGASISKSTLAATARYQRHSSGIRESILSSNSRYCKVRARTLYISLRYTCAPKQQKRRASKRVTRRMRENPSPSIYATEKYSVVRGFTPVRRYLPQKMECINEWNEKKQPRKGSAVSGGDILRR